MSFSCATKAPAKRKHFANHNQKNPKRGGPGVLLTCETGREKKCRQDALDILNHYYKIRQETRIASDKNNIKIVGCLHDHDSHESIKKEPAKLSLDDEIKLLQTTKETQVFSSYETGVRGVVILLCNRPDAVLLPPLSWNKEKFAPSSALKECGQPENNCNDDADQQQPEKKKVKIDQLQQNQSIPQLPRTKSQLWDPINTVQRILNDLRHGGEGCENHDNPLPPTSRFVIRMVPLQVSCFANESEISHYAKELFQWKQNEVPVTINQSADLSASTSSLLEMNAQGTSSSGMSNLSTTNRTTFAIQVRRRICSHLSSQDVIDWIFNVAPKTWNVNLSSPKFTIVVEICKTLCGMSIIEDIKEYENFNLIQTKDRERQKRREKE